MIPRSKKREVYLKKYDGFLLSGLTKAQKLQWLENNSDIFYIMQPVSGGGPYSDTSFLVPATDGDVVERIRPKGGDLWSPSDLEKTTTYNFTNEQLWYRSRGDGFVYKDYSGFGDPMDKGLEVLNGLPKTYETGPGQITPAQASFREVIEVFRWIGGEVYEFVASGIVKIFPDGDVWLYALSGGPYDIGVSVTQFETVIIKFKHWADDTWELWINGVLAASSDESKYGTLTWTSTTEWDYGSNAHPLSHLMYLGLVNTTELASTGETTRDGYILDNWPNALPDWPLLSKSGSYIASSELTALSLFQRLADSSGDHKFDILRDTSRGDDLKALSFSGGSGVEGTHEFKWWFYSQDEAFFPRQVQSTDAHLPFDTAVVVITGGTTGTILISDGGTNIMSAAESFDTDWETTAANVVANINAHSTDHHAWAAGRTILIQNATGTIAAAVTLTLTAEAFDGAYTDATGQIIDLEDFIVGNTAGNYPLLPELGTESSSSVKNTLSCLMKIKDDNGDFGPEILSQWLRPSFGDRIIGIYDSVAPNHLYVDNDYEDTGGTWVSDGSVSDTLAYVSSIPTEGANGQAEFDGTNSLYKAISAYSTANDGASQWIKIRFDVVTGTITPFRAGDFNLRLIGGTWYVYSGGFRALTGFSPSVGVNYNIVMNTILSTGVTRVRIEEDDGTVAHDSDAAVSGGVGLQPYASISLGGTGSNTENLDGAIHEYGIKDRVLTEMEIVHTLERLRSAY